jgi:6-phosphogluconolactonase
MYKHYFLLMTALLVVSSGCRAQKSKLSPSNDEQTMLVGTYTDASTAQGVYVYRFNQNMGTAKMVSVAKASNPSYVVATGNNKFAYSVCEYDNGKQGAIAYRLDKKQGKLTVINFQSTIDRAAGKANGKDAGKDGSSPCFIMTNGKQVVTANYGGGDISVFPVDKNGGLLPQSQHFCFKGNDAGIVSHLHCVRLTPDGKYLIADDLGNDCIYRFNVNNNANYLNKQPYLSNCTTVFKGTKNMGPRHIVFSANGKYAYLINELGGIVVVFSYQNGQMKPIQTIMADEGDGHGSADIHISPDGKFLYTSHRLKKDGVAIFKIDQTTGKITKIGYQQTGKHPRNFNITPNGKYLLVASRDNNEIEVYKINKTTGMLTDTAQRIKIGKPVCIQFLK